MRSGTASTVCAPTSSATRSSSSNRALTSASAASPVTRLDAPHAGADAAFADDHEVADLAARAAMGPAAQLVAVALDPDGPHASRRTSRRRTRRRRPRSPPPSTCSSTMTGRSSRTTPADLGLDRALLVVGEGPVEREVEAQVIGRDQRARLAGLLADDVAQRAMEQVRAGVVAHRVRRADRRPRSAVTVSPTASAALQVPAVDDEAARRAAGCPRP